MNDLIERLKQYTDFDNAENQNMPQGLELMEEAITALESIPAWVKCSERLPEEDGAYMTFDGEDVGEAFYTKAEGFRWQTGWAAKIEYWSELPAPPKSDPITEPSCVEQGG